MIARATFTAGTLACIVAVCLAGAARAQDRPSESDIFGAPAPSAGDDADAGTPSAPDEKAPQPPAASAATPNESRDDAVLGSSSKPMFTDELPPEDPLTIGGTLYMRAQATGYAHTAPGDYSLSSPTLMDAFFDARPNDRVRGFVLGRMTFDPLQPTVASTLSNTATMNMTGTSGTTSIAPAVSGQTNTPRLALDQFWMRFDLAHRVCVTAGRQHVRWGTGRFWAPTDFLHMRRRNPLDVFDARTGTTMVKLHLPIEEQAWNFYAYGITEGSDGLPTFKTPAGALRAEIVFGQLELGLGVFGRAKSRAKFAGDLSFGLGDIDFYGEVAVVDARDSDRVRFAEPGSMEISTQPAAASLSLIDALYPVYRDTGYRPQAVIGLNYTRRYAENDTFTIGAEYFYNGLGYDNSDVYFGLFLPHQRPLVNSASSFYLGKHYGALFVTFPAPFKLDLHTFTLSTLGNLSDKSFTTRLDYAYVLLTHLRFEAFASVQYGKRGGEFRFVVPSVAGLDLSGVGLRNEPALFAVGLGLRLSI